MMFTMSSKLVFICEFNLRHYHLIKQPTLVQDLYISSVELSVVQSGSLIMYHEGTKKVFIIKRLYIK